MMRIQGGLILEAKMRTGRTDSREQADSLRLDARVLQEQHEVWVSRVRNVIFSFAEAEVES